MENNVLDAASINLLKNRVESHFLDFKSKRIQPAKLSRTVCAFANSDGGELYVGIEDPSGGWKWDGFQQDEECNGIVQAISSIFPLGEGIKFELISYEGEVGSVLRIDVAKSSDIKRTADHRIYLRRGAQNIPLSSELEIDRLKLNKGLVSHEDVCINSNPIDLYSSTAFSNFQKSIIPQSTPEVWMGKQRLVRDGKPSVAGVVLFSDEPQVDLPKAAVKIYRYRTSDEQGSRANLEFDPITIEGCAYAQIFDSVDKVITVTEQIPIVGAAGFEKIQYPQVAIHEVITNAIIHRDYSLNDDVHVRIFDNRIEIESPGVLPAHITEKNILRERFARNPKIVRLLNKHPNPPNKDVGEGLNSSFEAMRQLKLKEPEIRQRQNSVLVVLKHERLGSSEEIVVNFLKGKSEINNATARGLCAIGDANKMKRVFQGMMKSGIIEAIPERAKRNAGYRRGPNFPT